MINSPSLHRQAITQKMLVRNLSIQSGHLQHEMNDDIYMRINESVPALSLPTEIACAIFKMASRSPPPFGLVALPKDIRYMRMEVNISQVCRLWRSMALTYRDLWSTFSHDDLWSCHIPLDCLSAYLQRSGNRPLDLYFRLGEGKRADWVTTMELLVAHVSRWRRLSLRINRPWPVDYLFHQIEHLSAPILEMLEISNPHFPPDSHPFGANSRLKPFFKELKGAPKLVSIRLDSSSFKQCEPPDWSILTAVNVHIEDNFPTRYLDKAPWATFVSLLCSSNLMHLSLIGDVFEFPLIGELTTVVIASHLVNFRCSDNAVIYHMWDLVRAPRLKLLIIKNYPLTNLYSPHLHQLDDAGIFPSLSNFILINCPQYVYGPSILDHAMHHVKHIIIVKVSDFSTIMDNLLSDTEGRLTWPGLETIVYLNLKIRKGSRREDPSKYLAMLERRSRVLNKKCMLGLNATQANRLKAKDSESWTKIIQGGFFLGTYNKKHDSTLIPWPARDEAHFDVSSEKHFSVWNDWILQAEGEY